MRLKNKVAIITGGAAGIGQATAELFAEEGARVIVSDIDVSAGEQTTESVIGRGGEAIFVAADVAREADVRRLCDEAVRHFGGIDILVNNAAVFVLQGIGASVEDWQRSLGVNVVGTALCIKHAAEAMKKRGGGVIVNLSSISAFVAQPDFVTYSATKAAILQMTRNVALDLAPFGIRANCVCPGTILTRASHDHMARTGMTLEDFLAAEGAKHPLRRVGRPREVGHAILFLASDEASFITGTHLMVDGGYTLI